jgi:uncharacterized damage-inducible protein DinB
MKVTLTKYAHYNCWANQQILEVIYNLTDEQIHREVISSFPSIYKTVLHMLDAEAIWWQRLKLVEVVEVPSATFNGTIMELGNTWVRQSKQIKEWVDLAVAGTFTHEFSYMTSKKVRFKQPVYEVLMHLFNHQSYHRGQLVTLLRQTGCTTIPSTDLINFLRKK